jgi:hypothetical protein
MKANIMSNNSINPKITKGKIYVIFTKLIILALPAFFIGSYIYWVFLKILGVLMFNKFVYDDKISIVHGAMSFKAAIIISPLLVPFHIFCSLIDNRIEYVNMHYDETPEGNIAIFILILSFILSLIFGYALVYILYKYIIHRRRNTQIPRQL